MNLNPFDLRGPEFLVFYVALLVVTAIVARIFRRLSLEPGGGAGKVGELAHQIAQDPYQVAYLRGGREELLRVAVVSLLERGLLEADGDRVVLADRDAAAKVRHNLDKTVLMVVAGDGDARKLQSHVLAKREADLYGPPLQRLGLLPDHECQRASRALAFVCVLFLWIVAGVKIGVALSRGHHNLVFLVILSIIAPLVLIAVTHPRLTGLGQDTCRCLRDLFAGLHNRNQSLQLGKTTSELTFLAAVFGMVALPTAVSLVLKPLRLQPQTGSGSGCGSGSSCGGGGGCGGGGCGGGCGGCS